MTLECIELQSGPAPKTSLIVLHGLGADGHDFVPVCQALDLRSLGDVRCVLPHGPTRPVTLNGGHVMRAWYDIVHLGPGLRAEDAAGLRASQALVNELIDREVARGVPAERVILMGFSQGCAMALMTGLRYPHGLGGLIGLSGYLPLAELTGAERHAANTATPLFLAHGRQDPVIALDRALAGRDALLALGATPEWHEYDMPHSVCEEEIADIQTWLLRVLG